MSEISEDADRRADRAPRADRRCPRSRRPSRRSTSTTPLVGIIMGSKNDKPKMQPAGAGAARRRHPLRGAGDERPPRPRDGPRVLHERADAGAEGDHRRRRDVGGAARRRRRPHRPAGDRRADPRQGARRPRRAALGGADAARDPGRLRRDRRRQERRRARRADNQRDDPPLHAPGDRRGLDAAGEDGGWLEVELAATEAWAEEGVVPREAAEAARAKAAFTVEAVDERERVTDHDVAAFVDVVAASVGEHGPLDPLRPHLLRRPRHGAGAAAAPGRRDRRRRRPRLPRRPARAGARAPRHALRRPHPRRPRRADHLRPAPRRLRLRGRPQPRAGSTPPSSSSPSASSPARSAPTPRSRRRSRRG